MDPLSLVAATLIAKAVENFGGEVGKSAWGGLRHLVDLVRGHLGATPSEVKPLTEVETSPADPARVDALARAIDVRLTDTDFRHQLEDALKQSMRDASIRTIVTQISDNAVVEKLVNIGDVKGDVIF